MTEAAAVPFQRHDDNSVLTLLLGILVTVLIIAFAAQKRKPTEEEVVPPTAEELRFIRDRRAQTLLNTSSIATADTKEEQDEGEEEGQLIESNQKERNSPPEDPESNSQSTQTTTEEDLTAAATSDTAAAIPHNTSSEPQKHSVEAMNNESTIDIEPHQTAKPSITNEGTNGATIDDIDHIAQLQQGEQPSIPIGTTSKKHHVPHASGETASKKMKPETLGSTGDGNRQSRLLSEQSAPLPQAPEQAASTQKDPPPPEKKRARKKFSRPQFLSDMLSSVTKLQVIVVSDDGKEYRPRKGSGESIKVSFSDDQPFSSVKQPRLPKTFRDLSCWFARAHATSRNGFPPHMTSAKDDGYDDFQLLLSNLMSELAQKSLERLENDQVPVADDEDDDEDDLFSSYVRPDPQLEASSPTISFLSLLEETPPIVGRPFLDHILKKNPDLASTLLQRGLTRLDKPPSLSAIPKRATAIATLIQSPLVVQAWTKRMQKENTLGKEKNGNEVEASSWIRPLLRACAHCIPEAGAELPTAPLSQYRNELEQLEGFPASLYDRQNQELGVFQKQNFSQMHVTRNVALTVLRKGGKMHLFQWIGEVVQANDAMGSMLRTDLLAENGVASLSSSRGFLLGLASSVVDICCDSLVDLFAKDKSAFDCRYLTDGRLDIAQDELMMVRNKRRPKSEEAIKFSGGTEFFFLTCSLLRVSLYPALRIEGAFQRHYQQIFSAVTKAHNDKTGLSPHLLSVGKPVMAALMGWKTFLDDPDFVAKITKFAILQLQWVLTQKDNFEVVPEWMCKNPATWLAHIAQSSPRLLKPHQAAATIECATQLLQVGTKANDERALSPVVIDDLVKIVAGFVNAGVNRAKQKQRRRGGDNFDGDRDSSLYLSFDQNDLGVTVFTNELVSKELCPTLMQTFGAVDVVEGLDVDREHGFDKFSAKGRIAELFLRLWSHPNGECRASVVRMEAGLISQFAKEIEIAIGVLLDFSCNRMADICNGAKKKQQSRREQAFLDGQGRSVSAELYYARLWLLLLCRISEDPRIRQILGSSPLATHLSSLMIHFIDILTDPDGGIHQSLDLAKERSSALASSRPEMTLVERQESASDVSKARYVCRVLYGLDASTLAHQFIALLSCWHKASRDKDGKSSILEAFAGHDDYEELQYRNIVRRLISSKQALQGAEGDCAEAIFEHDGYVDVSAWEQTYRDSLDKSANAENQIRSAKRDHMTTEQIEVLASISDISAFLDSAELFKAQSTKSQTSVVAISPEDLEKSAEALLTTQSEATSETYSEKLSDWLVSSETFASPQDGKRFAHYYDGVARTRNMACSGKIMVKEAKRCHKNLPVPHPNSAAFCCFAEERMDLCRSCITGPVDTPYAHGIFVFEVFFPANYPTIPPLVTFMTTGGGQTRFNPNLYSDGKVCLSLLGTFHAQDESQKWNPGYSSLAQILLSIQTQLLVEEPYFNEPGNEARQGTPDGKNSSIRYNLILQLATLRHAILAPLKEPPIGLEEICDRHFSLCRRRIVVQARRWMLEAKAAKSTLFPRFERAYAQLVTVLASKYDNASPSLPPCELDVKALKAMGPLLKGIADPGEKKKRAKPRVVRVHVNAPAATVSGRTARRVQRQEVSEISLAAALMTAASILEDNPWANPAAAAQSSGHETTEDGDDELYE